MSKPCINAAAALLAASRSTVCALALSFGACGITAPLNPSFPIDSKQADERLGEFRRSPVKTERPIIVLSGFQDPGFGSMSVAKRLRRAFTDANSVLTVSFLADRDFDICRTKLIRHVEAAFPSPEPDRTIEVDVIGISMGGLIARHAARDLEGGSKRLRIARLYCIGTPHRGARMAGLPTLDNKQIDMRAGSEFLQQLNADPTSHDFEMVSYARLGDSIVGIENAAMPGEHPWWLPNLPLQFAHLSIASDARIVADIIQRLRGEAPFTIGEPTPPPGAKQAGDSGE